jgi:hypothetical protein
VYAPNSLCGDEYARGDVGSSERCRSGAFGGDRGGSRQPAEACLAGADHSGDGGRLRHGGDHASRPGFKALCVVLAGSGSYRGDRRAGARHDGQSGRHQRPARCNASVARMGCKPHRVRQFKLSRIRGSPPSCVTIGRYVDLPAHAVVFSVDETSQIQALDPTQRGCRRTATSAYLHTVTDASIQRSGSALRGSRNAAGRNPAIVSRPTRSAASECNQYGKAGRA